MLNVHMSKYTASLHIVFEFANTEQEQIQSGNTTLILQLKGVVRHAKIHTAFDYPPHFS